MTDDSLWAIDLARIDPDDSVSVAMAGARVTNLAGLQHAGVAVPDGVVVTSAVARYRAEHGGKWPTGASAQVRRCLGRLEKKLGMRYGKGPRPLLLAVRPSPGPGLHSPMGAVLCCGLHPDLADYAVDPVAFWNLYLWYVRDFACRVHGLERRVFDDMVDGGVDDPQQGRSRVEVCFKRFRKHTRRKFPTRTWDQLKQAIDAIFDAGVEPSPNAGASSDVASSDVASSGVVSSGVASSDVALSDVALLSNTGPTRGVESGLDVEPSLGVGAAVARGCVVGSDSFVEWPAVLIGPMMPVSARAVVHTQDPEDPLADSVRVEVLPGLLTDVEDDSGQSRQADGGGGTPGSRWFHLDRSRAGGVAGDDAVSDYNGVADHNSASGDDGTSDRDGPAGDGVSGDGMAGADNVDGMVADATAGVDFNDVIASAAICLRRDDGRAMDPVAWFPEARLQGLARQALAVEAHMGRPVVVAFAVGPRHAMLLDARAAGVDPVAAQVEATRDAIVERLTGLAGRGHGPWVRCALDERLTYPTTLTWDLVRRLAGADSGMGRLLRQAGYRPAAGLNGDGAFECIAGRMYVDTRRLGRLFMRPSPTCSDLLFDGDGDSGAATDAAEALLDFPPRCPGDMVGGHTHARLPIVRPAQWWVSWRVRRRSRRWVRCAAQRWRDDILPRYLGWLDDQRDQPLEAMDDGALLAALERCVGGLLDDWAGELFFPGWLAPAAFESLAGLLEQIMGLEHGREYALALTQSLDDDMTRRLAYDLVETAAGRMDQTDFVAEHGHRTAGELELANPRWRDDPRLLERPVRRLATETGRAAAQRLAEARARRRQAHDDLPVQLRRWGATTFEADIVREVSIVQDLLACRESAWHFFMLGYEQIRRVVEALARRSGLGRRIYDLHFEELFRVSSDPSGLLDLARSRGIRRRAAQRLETPARIEPDRIGEQLAIGSGPPGEAGDSDGEPLVGRSLNPGLVSAPVHVVVGDPFDNDVPPGRIVVCRAVDVGWIPVLLAADGLIVEQGDLMGAAGLTARALGVPAMAWPSATRRLRTGDQVRMDAHDGRLVRMGG